MANQTSVSLNSLFDHCFRESINEQRICPKCSLFTSASCQEPKDIAHRLFHIEADVELISLLLGATFDPDPTDLRALHVTRMLNAGRAQLYSLRRRQLLEQKHYLENVLRMVNTNRALC